MPRPRLLAAPALALSLAALAPMQCAPEPVRSGPTYHAPIGTLASPTSYTCRYSRQWQIDVGQPVVYIRYQKHGATTFTNSGSLNVADLGNAEVTIAAYSSTGFANATCTYTHS